MNAKVPVGDGSQGKANLQSRVLLEEKVRTRFLQHCTRLFSCQMEAVKKTKKLLVQPHPPVFPLCGCITQKLQTTVPHKIKKLTLRCGPHTIRTLL